MTGPRFRQIAAELRERIALGDIGRSGALESEAALGQRYDASRMTIRKALQVLAAESLIESRQGSGWFVTNTSFQQQLALGTFRHAASAVSQTGHQLERRVASFAFTELPQHLSGLLALPPRATVLQCRSVRSTGREPLDRVTEWVPATRAEHLSRADAVSPGIWQSLLGHGHRISRVRQTITAGIAGELDAELLGIDLGLPLLLIRRLAIGPDGVPVALSDHRYLAHRFSLDVEFNGWSDVQTDVPPGLRQQIA